jgi:hypothetical protein
MSYIESMTASRKHAQHHSRREAEKMYQHDVRTYLEWHAPGRPFKERSPEYFYTGFLFLAAFSIIVYLLFKSVALILAIGSLGFLWFALSAVPPHDFYYKITSEGVRVEDYFYIWEELYDFFFIKHHGQEVLYITTKDYFPGELKLTLGDISVDEIKAVLLPYLPYREYVKPTFMEKSGEWLSQNFPLEK